MTFCLIEQDVSSFYRSRFKYGVRSWKTQHFRSYCSRKNVLFMGQSDIDPRARIIDLNRYVNLPIKILRQYEYAAELERLNLGQ